MEQGCADYLAGPATILVHSRDSKPFTAEIRHVHGRGMFIAADPQRLATHTYVEIEFTSAPDSRVTPGRFPALVSYKTNEGAGLLVDMADPVISLALARLADEPLDNPIHMLGEPQTRAAQQTTPTP